MKKIKIILILLCTQYNITQAQQSDIYIAPTGNLVTHSGAQMTIFGNLINDARGTGVTISTAQAGFNHNGGGTVYLYRRAANGSGNSRIYDGPLATATTNNYNAGGSVVRFYNLITDNNVGTATPSGTIVNGIGGTGQIQIEQEVCISNLHTFTNGKLWTPRNNWRHAFVHYDADVANYTGAGAPNTNSILQIDGYAAKTGSSGFTFPIGDGIYLRNCGLNAPASGQYKAAYFAKNAPINGTIGLSGNNALPDSLPNMVASLYKVNKTEFWDIDGTASSNFTLWALNSVANYSEWNNTINFNGLEPSDIVITGFDKWENLEIYSVPTSFSMDGPFNSIIATTPDPNYSAYTWANTLLRFMPISFSNFSYHLQNCIPTLIWSTVNEQNLNRFEIERSFDGISFKTIGVKNTNSSSSSSLQNYSYIDNSNNKISAYYRIKMINTNGNSQISSTLFVKNNCLENDKNVQVYPNPFNNAINVILDSKENETLQISIVAMDGKQIAFSNKNVIKGINSINLNTANIISGNYVLQIKHNNGLVERCKIVKLSKK